MISQTQEAILFVPILTAPVIVQLFPVDPPLPVLKTNKTNDHHPVVRLSAAVPLVVN